MTFIFQNILEIMTMLIFWVIMGDYAFKGRFFCLGPVSNHLASHIYLHTEFYTIKIFSNQCHSNKQENSVDVVKFINY